MNLDDIAARHKRGDGITLDEHAALTASRRLPDPYRKIGRGGSRIRKWEWHIAYDGGRPA